MADDEVVAPRKPRGFATWDPEKRREAQRKGGSAPRPMRAFQDRKLASRAGKLGLASRYRSKTQTHGEES
jgi:general stress protein YciG